MLLVIRTTVLSAELPIEDVRRSGVLGSLNVIVCPRLPLSILDRTVEDMYGCDGCPEEPLRLNEEAAEEPDGFNEMDCDNTGEFIDVLIDVKVEIPERRAVWMGTPKLDEIGAGVPGGSTMLEPDDSIDVTTPVKVGVRVTKVLKRLGGATLSSHSVVPLTTE
jgi:hypothetical protein